MMEFRAVANGLRGGRCRDWLRDETIGPMTRKYPDVLLQNSVVFFSRFDGILLQGSMVSLMLVFLMLGATRPQQKEVKRLESTFGSGPMKDRSL